MWLAKGLRAGPGVRFLDVGWCQWYVSSQGCTVTGGVHSAYMCKSVMYVTVASLLPVLIYS